MAVPSPYALDPNSPYVSALTPQIPGTPGAPPTSQLLQAPGSAGGPTPSPSPTPPANPFLTPTGTQPGSAPGTPGTYAPGSPNDPASQGNGQAADTYALQLLNNGSGNTNYQSIVDQLNSQFGLAVGKGFQYYPTKGAPPGVIAAAGGGYYAIDQSTGKWAYNVGDSQGGSSTAPTVGSGAYVPGQGVSGQGTVFGPDNPLTPQMSAYLATLVGELGPNSNNPAFSTDPNNPVIQNQVQAYGVQQQQGVRNTEAQLAEQGSGGPVTTDATTRSLNEKAGQATSGYFATLMGQQNTARQQEIEQVLQQYGTTLTQEQSMQLQEELSQLQLAQQAYQNGQTNLTANNQLALQYGG